MSDRRPVFHARIGLFLVELREGRGWSQGQVVIQTKGKIKIGTLKSLEAGRIKHPDAADLHVLAVAYGVQYESLASRFVEANYGSDLIRPNGDQESDLSEGAQANVPAEARVELERLRELVGRYETEAREVRTATDAIVRVALRLEQIRKTESAKPNRRSRDRKVG